MLDPQGRNEVLDTLEELNHRLGITVVLITHHMDEAARAQRLIVMHKGEIRKDGAPSQVFRDIAGMEELGLSVPETYQLLDGLRKAGWDIPMEGLSAQDCAETITQFLEKRGQSIGAHH
jgi:energy-coupling factor transport system ATP-binding protein